MKPQDLVSNTDKEFQNLLDLLGLTEKYLEDIKIDRNRVKSFKQLLRFLRSLPEESIREILSDDSLANQKAGKRLPDLAEEDVFSMPIERILEVALNEETPRRHLEQIAALRFGVTRGALSALRNRRALAEKIVTLVNNENAHESITQAARQQGSRHP